MTDTSCHGYSSLLCTHLCSGLSTITSAIKDEAGIQVALLGHG